MTNELDIILLRHGQRDGPQLTDAGREDTRIEGQNLAKLGTYDTVLVYGSPIGEDKKTGVLGRATETAAILAREIANTSTNVRIRSRQIVGFNGIQLPYNHEVIFKTNLPNNFALLSASEQRKASDCATNTAVQYFDSLNSPEANQTKSAISARIRTAVSYCMRGYDRVRPQGKTAIVLGTHATMSELFLVDFAMHPQTNQKAFTCIPDLGGALGTSESVTIRQKGTVLQVHFNNPIREQYLLEQHGTSVFDLNVSDIVE